jgi:hypothetical protein
MANPNDKNDLSDLLKDINDPEETDDQDMFEHFKAQGLKPEDLFGSAKEEYAEWLKEKG